MAPTGTDTIIVTRPPPPPPPPLLIQPLPQNKISTVPVLWSLCTVTNTPCVQCPMSMSVMSQYFNTIRSATFCSARIERKNYFFFADLFPVFHNGLNSSLVSLPSVVCSHVVLLLPRHGPLSQPQPDPQSLLGAHHGGARLGPRTSGIFNLAYF